MPKIPAAHEVRNAKAIAEAGPLYDRINAAWEKAEAYVQKLGVLAPAEFMYYDAGEGDYYYLGVQKRNGKWRICHGNYDFQEEMRAEVEGYEYCTSWTPIAECGSELRIEMLKHLGKLIEKIVETNEKTVPELAKSVEEAESSLKKLGIL